MSQRDEDATGAFGFQGADHTLDDGNGTVFADDLWFHPKTITGKLFAIRIFLDWLDRDGPKRLQDVTPQHIEKFLAGQRERGLAGATIDGLTGGLRKFFRYLEDTQRIFANPTANMEIRWTPKRLKPVPTEDEMRKLLAAPDTNSMFGLRDRAMLELLYTTGVRIGEMLALDVEGGDLELATARVFGKGKKERMVPVGKTALKFLESYLVAIRPFLLTDKSERALFVYRGRRLGYQVFLHMVHAAADRAKLDKHVSPHTFRRSCTTELIRGGANMYHVKELLGHETLATLKHYARLTILDLKKTHEKCHPREREALK